GLWSKWYVGTGPTVVQSDELEIDVPASSTPDPATRAIVAGLWNHCKLDGDFDVQVDYRLLDWPAASGVHLNFGTTSAQAGGRQNVGGEVAFAWFPPSVVNEPYADSQGSLRLVRHGSMITGHVRRSDGSWWKLLTARSPSAEATIQMAIS